MEEGNLYCIWLQSPLERKKQFVSIRNEVKEDKEERGDSSSGWYSSSFNIASQYLVDSSLHSELQQYDGSMSGVAQVI